MSYIWILAVDPWSPAHRKIRPLWTDFVAEFGNKLVWRSTRQAPYHTAPLSMHHPTGAFSGRDGGFYLGGKFGCVVMVKQFPHERHDSRFLKEHLYTESYCGFSAVADSVLP